MSLAEFDKHLECAKLEARQGREELAVRHLEEARVILARVQEKWRRSRARVIVDEIACKRIECDTGKRFSLEESEMVIGGCG